MLYIGMYWFARPFSNQNIFRTVYITLSQELRMVYLMTLCHLYLDNRLLVPYNINDIMSLMKMEGLACQRLQMNI